jgi:hypothetical protein
MCKTKSNGFYQYERNESAKRIEKELTMRQEARQVYPWDNKKIIQEKNVN